MALYLLVVEGELKGKRFELKAGQTIGRLKGDIVLKDHKVSNHHATVKEEGGQFILYDNKSTNGVKVGSKRLEKVILKPGVTVQLGRTYLEVLDSGPIRSRSGETDTAASPTGGSPVSTEIALEEPPWDEFLEEFAKKLKEGISDLPESLKPFKPAVALEFVRGLQVETRWVLGYGPRKVGAKSYEFPIHEPGAPDVCFEVQADGERPRFFTDHPRNVLINGQSLSSHLLQAGDVISINGTLIEVKLLS